LIPAFLINLKFGVPEVLGVPGVLGVPRVWSLELRVKG
jgi:hypothetical protein